MLIPNARHVALKSWSLWANRLGFASLVCPWVVFEVTGAGPDPVLFGWIGVAFYLLAEALRFIDQGGLDGRRDTFFSPAWVGLLALVAVLVTMGMGRWVNDPSPPEATLAQGPPSDAQVLDVAVPLVSKWEGLRTEAYLDTIANPPVCTICFGETDGIQCFPPEIHAPRRNAVPVCDACCRNMVMAGIGISRWTRWSDG